MIPFNSSVLRLWSILVNLFNIFSSSLSISDNSVLLCSFDFLSSSFDYYNVSRFPPMFIEFSFFFAVMDKIFWFILLRTILCWHTVWKRVSQLAVTEGWPLPTALLFVKQQNFKNPFRSGLSKLHPTSRFFLFTISWEYFERSLKGEVIFNDESLNPESSPSL
jgi:hypothetical protein